MSDETKDILIETLQAQLTTFREKFERLHAAADKLIDELGVTQNAAEMTAEAGARWKERAEAAERRGVIYLGWRNQHKERAEVLSEQLDAIIEAAIKYGVHDEIAAVIAHAELVTGRRGAPDSPDETRATIYLSGPISLGGSLSPDETTAFVDVFAAHAATLRAVGAHVINPCECERQDSWEDYMRLGISSVCVSDYVAVLPRWVESRGAILEVFVARQLGIPVVPVEEVAALAGVGEHRPDQPQKTLAGAQERRAPDGDTKGRPEGRPL